MEEVRIEEEREIYETRPLSPRYQSSWRKESACSRSGWRGEVSPAYCSALNGGCERPLLNSCEKPIVNSCDRPLSPRWLDAPFSPRSWKRGEISTCDYACPSLKSRLSQWKKGVLPLSYWDDPNLAQSCVSKPYLNVAEAFLLKDRSVDSTILTSPSALFIDIDEFVERFPNAEAAYNIFIRVSECNAEKVGLLNLSYALFVLDPLGAELTLTALLPQLHHDGYYVFFYGTGMISLHGGVLVVKETELPDNLIKLVRSPSEYPCRSGTWYEDMWQVYAVNLDKKQAKCLEKLSCQGSVELEHIKITNQNKMIYGDCALRAFIEAAVLNIGGDNLPIFVLSGIGSLPLLETIIYVYSLRNGLVCEEGKIKVDYLMESWLGDSICSKFISMKDLRKILEQHRAPVTAYHKMLLSDPLLVRLIREEQEEFRWSKICGDEAPYQPELLEDY